MGKIRRSFKIQIGERKHIRSTVDLTVGGIVGTDAFVVRNEKIYLRLIGTSLLQKYRIRYFIKDFFFRKRKCNLCFIFNVGSHNIIFPP